MEFREFASKLESARHEPARRRVELLAGLLFELAPEERASAVYLLQGRFGLPNQPRRPSVPRLSSVQSELARTRHRARAAASHEPSVREVYQTLHTLVESTADVQLPSNYAWQLRGLTKRLDDVSLEWLARILWKRLVAEDKTLIKALVHEAGRREPGLSAGYRALHQLYRSTIPYLGHIAELLAQQPLIDVVSLGPQHGYLVPREEIQLWKTIEDAWQDLQTSHVFVQGKLDGEHVQIHKRNAEVILLSVSGREVTTQLPDVAQLVSGSLAAKSAIVDAEVVPYDPVGQQVLPFYKTFHSTHHQVVIFDVLLWEGKDWRGRPYWQRGQLLHRVVPKGLLEQPGICHAEEIETHTLAEARAAYEAFVGKPHYEGAILKHAHGKCMSGRTSHHRGKVKDYLALDSVLLGYSTDPERYLVGLWGDRKHTVLVSYKTVEHVTSEEERERLLDYCRTHTLHDVPAGVNPHPAPQHWVEPGLVVDVRLKGSIIPSSRYGDAGWTFRGASEIRGIYGGKSVHEVNDLSFLRSLLDVQDAASGR